MHVAVGSTNPVKCRATEQAAPRGWTVAAADVDSGVSEQPWGHAETVNGAETRAERALAAAGATIGVGIEGGVARFDAVDGLWLVMWAAATDGERWGRGSGPALVLPERVATRVEDGGELGPVLDDLLGTDDIKKKQGAAGVLTGGAIDRTSSLVHAVAGALGPFVTDQYD